MKSLILTFIVLLLLACTCFASEGHIYSTWDALEVDNCASAWLIKKFIDPQAVFQFYRKGEFIAEGTAFDTPDAEFRRTQNMSTFESILTAYTIQDPALAQIAKMIHEFEVNYWSKTPSREIQSLNEKILTISQGPEKTKKKLQKTFLLFDELYKSFPQRNH